MDPVTHGLSGALLSQLGFRQKTALAVLIISAMAPDLDYIAGFWGTDALLHYHRGITHSILALFLFPVIMGVAFLSRGGFLYNFGLSFLGYASHLGLDLTNQYGTRLLSPFTETAYALDITFIIDPLLILLFSAALIGCWKIRSRTVIIACCTLLILCGYLGVRYYLQGQARQLTKQEIDANSYKVYPVPNGLFRWWFVAKTDDDVTTGIADIFMQKVLIYKKRPRNMNHPSVEATRTNYIVNTFLNFSRQPHAEVMLNKNGTLVIWRELSYAYLPGDRFQVQVIIGNNNAIKEARLFY